MENKKTFGEYICRRRKELGLTQREFADKLYVTESAVSKWERGLSYPDVTLLRDICAVLDITEHELLTASEDTEKRTAEKLAAKYLRLARNYRVTQYILYGGTILICFIVNLAVQHTLSWFWIVLASVLLAASLTLAPALVSMRPALERYKWAVSLGCAAASLELLLLICCLYTGGNWFWVAFAGTIFGLSLALLPFLLPTLPLPAALAGRKTSLYLGLETVLLILLLLVCCLYTGGDWLILAAAGTLFGLSVVFLPVFLRQLPLPQALGRHKALAYFSLETVFLMALLAVVCWRTGGDWFLTQGVPQALAALTLPWGLMALIRYLPVSGWFRASASCAWTGLWLWLYPWVEERILTANGWTTSRPYRLLIPFDFSYWGPYVTPAADGAAVYDNSIASNVMVIILLSLGALAVILAAVGAARKARRRK